MPAPDPTVLTSGALAANVLTTTASVSPASDGAQLVWIFAQRVGGFADTTTVVGNGRTWTKLQSLATGNFYGGLFVGYGASPSSGTIAITLSNAPTSGRYVVVQQTDVDNSVNPISSSAQGNGNSTTGTVVVTASKNRVITFFGHNATEVTAPDATGATWTELHDPGAVAMNIECQWLAGGDFTNTATWATSSIWAAAAAVFKIHTTAVKFFESDPLVKIGGLAILLDSDEEGPNLPGKPSGVWAIVGGNE